MVVLNRIYTRTGDDGTTARGSGERRPKYDLRVAAYGTVDETNAVSAVARLHLKDAREQDSQPSRMSRSATPRSSISTVCRISCLSPAARRTITAAGMCSGCLAKTAERANFCAARVDRGWRDL